MLTDHKTHTVVIHYYIVQYNGDSSYKTKKAQIEKKQCPLPYEEVLEASINRLRPFEQNNCGNL